MNHRIVSGIIAVVVLVFVGAALLFALRAGPLEGSRGSVAVPHGLDGDHAECLACHAPGGPATPVPPTHRSFTGTTCSVCHPVAAR